PSARRDRAPGVRELHWRRGRGRDRRSLDPGAPPLRIHEGARSALATEPGAARRPGDLVAPSPRRSLARAPRDHRPSRADHARPGGSMKTTARAPLVGQVLGREDATPLGFWVAVHRDAYLQLDDVGRGRT